MTLEEVTAVLKQAEAIRANHREVELTLKQIEHALVLNPVPLPQIQVGPRECMYPRKCEKCSQRLSLGEPAIKVEAKYWHNWKCS